MSGRSLDIRACASCQRDISSERHQFRVTRDFQRWNQPLEGFYDLRRAQDASLRLKELCNLIIHHFAFEVRSAKEAGVEVYFNSDRSRNRLLNMITLDAFLELVDDVAHDRAIFFSVDRQTKRQLRHRIRRLDLL